MAKIQFLVGNATRADLRAVECYVGDALGIFIPSVGYCGYAARKGHTHPAWSFVLYFRPEDAHVPREIDLPDSHCLAVAMEPDFPHEESERDTVGRYAAVQVLPEFFARVWALYSPLPPPECSWRQFTVHADAFLYIKRFMNECDSCPPLGAASGDGLSTPPLARALEEPIVHLIARGLAAFVAADSREDASPVSSAAGDAGPAKTVPSKPVCGTGYRASSAETKRVVDHVERHYADPLAVPALAAIAGLSASAFTRRFHEETGLTPAEYVAEVRIRKAKLLLDDPSKSVTDVALACGFYDASHFSSTFLKATGINPSKYAALFATGAARTHAAAKEAPTR